MTKPKTPEYDAILAQAALLQQIDGSDDWHTRAGRTVYASPRPLVDQPGCIVCREVSVEPRGRPYNDQMVSIIWAAIIDLRDDDDLTPALVLADMRHALLCGDPRLSLISASIMTPDPGSDMAVVSVTTAKHTP